MYDPIEQPFPNALKLEKIISNINLNSSKKKKIKKAQNGQ